MFANYKRQKQPINFQSLYQEDQTKRGGRVLRALYESPYVTGGEVVEKRLQSEATDKYKGKKFILIIMKNPDIDKRAFYKMRDQADLQDKIRRSDVREKDIELVVMEPDVEIVSKALTKAGLANHKTLDEPLGAYRPERV